jgi:DNA-binding response OmpR family regulator
MRILIVEDDTDLAAVLRRGLEESGHVVDVEHDGEAGESTAAAGTYDALVLDVALPCRDGLAVARGLRAAGVTTPILMLTARDTVEEVIAGITAGADDYVRKPFAFAELEIRLHAIARRNNGEPPVDVLRAGALAFDLGARVAQIRNQPLALTARELAFLEVFMRNPGRTLTRAALEDALWDRDRDSGSNVVDAYVSRLRAKLARAGESSILETVRGIGYRLRADASS